MVGNLKDVIMKAWMVFCDILCFDIAFPNKFKFHIFSFFLVFVLLYYLSDDSFVNIFYVANNRDIIIQYFSFSKIVIFSLEVFAILHNYKSDWDEECNRQKDECLFYI